MDLVTILLLAFVFLVIGFLLGRMFGQFREVSDAELPEEERMDRDDVHIIRAATTGRLLIRHKKRTYHHVRSLPLEVHNKVLQMLVDLNKWVGHTPKTQKETEVEKVLIREKVDTLAEPLISDDVKPTTLVSSVTRAIRGNVKKKESPKSIVAQIDEILQEKLAVSTLENRGIRLMELPQKGLVVLVGLDQYENISDIPDDDIQRIIREAVDEWELNAGEEK